MNTSRAVFLLIGQSNMAGRGRLDEVPPLRDPRIVMWREAAWLPAEEPLHTDKAAAGIGLGMSFAHALLPDLAPAEIGLIPCAVGGTPLERWLAGGDLYENAVAQARASLADGFLAGILWHQGENDSAQAETADSYGQRISTLFGSLRQALNAPHAPVLIGELGPFLADHPSLPHYPKVNAALRQLADNLPDASFVPADGLGHIGDHLHFDAPSLRLFGQRYADAYRSNS